MAPESEFVARAILPRYQGFDRSVARRLTSFPQIIEALGKGWPKL